MPEMGQLYSDVILEHGKHAHNVGILEKANRRSEGYNPLCGDRLTLYLEVQDDSIRNASFQGSGCAISQASASLLTDSVKGTTVREAEALSHCVLRMLNSPNDDATEPDRLGRLSVLARVRAFPARVGCASLAWQTLVAALNSREEPPTALV